MELLRSSIIGKEFINYRKTTMKETRLNFSHKVRAKGIGNIPIVIDSVDKQLSDVLCEVNGRYKTYGKEIILHMDQTIKDVLKEIKIILLKKDYENILKNDNIVLGLEDGSIIHEDMTLGDLYKKYRNKDDKILYLLVSKETTVFGFILSIIQYLKDIIFNRN
jgi:hypothetical protein